LQFEKLKSMDLAGLLGGLCRSGPDQLTTVIHGELWENNILLANDLCHVGDGIKVVDWKNAKIATATLDLVRYHRCTQGGGDPLNPLGEGGMVQKIVA
jgi:hypothetical protein